MMTASELRAARALLGLDQAKLAGLCGLSVGTIERLETGGAHAAGDAEARTTLARTLVASGVELIEEGAASLTGGRGLRLRLAQGDGSRLHRHTATDFPLVGPHTD